MRRLRAQPPTELDNIAAAESDLPFGSCDFKDCARLNKAA